MLKTMVFALALAAAMGVWGQELYRNPEAKPEDRARDLVSRMTLEEKVAQMQSGAPAIERLGVAEYNWWNECLHGVARAGRATVFPQAIGMAAAWDTALMKRVAAAITMNWNTFTTACMRISGCATRNWVNSWIMPPILHRQPTAYGA